MSFYSANDAIYGSGEYGTASYNVVIPVVSLASVSATGQVTAVNPTISATLTGVSGTGQIGTATAVNDSSLTLGSVSATGQVNTVFENPSEAITGVSATVSIGTVFAQAFYGANDAIYGTGRYGIAIYGSKSPSINLPTFQLVGTIATVQVGGQFEVDVTEKLESVSATGQIGNIQTIPKVVASVSATGQLGTIKPNPTEALDAVSATGNVGTLTHSNTHSLGSVVGTFTVNKGDRPFAKTFNFLNAPSFVATGAIGTPEVTISEALLSVSATAQVGTIQPNISEPVDSVSATISAGVLTHSNTLTLSSVVGTTAVEQVQVDGFEIDVQERLGSVSATGAVGTLTNSFTHFSTGVVGTMSTNTVTATGVITTFSATAYDRRNVANTLPKQTSSQRRAA